MTGVKVIYGADEDEFDAIVGIEFAEAVGNIRELMQVPNEITDVRLNGKQDPLATTILKEADVITFYKRAGSKGI